MKNLVIALIIAGSAPTASAQEEISSWYDFWVGKWQVSWDEPEGKKGVGINHVVKILDDKVIQENFSTLEGAGKGYLGTSLSVYNPRTQQWHQGYADNQGTYFNFTGEKDGNRFIFKTPPISRDGKEIIQRMVFYDITQNALMWDWESTSDGGKTWTLNWRISYKRLE